MGEAVTPNIAWKRNVCVGLPYSAVSQPWWGRVWKSGSPVADDSPVTKSGCLFSRLSLCLSPREAPILLIHLWLFLFLFLTLKIKEHVPVNPTSSVCLLWSWSQLITGKIEQTWPCDPVTLQFQSWSLHFKWVQLSAGSLVLPVKGATACLSTTPLSALITGHHVWSQGWELQSQCQYHD